MTNRPLLVLLGALICPLLAGCDDGGAPLRFHVRGSIGQVFVTQADPRTDMQLLDQNGKLVQAGTTDGLGSLIFRQVAPGDGYVVRTAVVPGGHSDPIAVRAVAGSTPQQDFYAGQALSPGFGYIRTRDGTTLSAYITLPGPPDMGPYPTVVDYSGYNPSQPAAAYDDKYQFLCGDFPTLCNAPNDPAALLISFFGYATVSVNIRGTGCSGGAYDYFEELQVLDGYDVIETVAAQPWVLNHKVGMVGISYPGIAQLFVARERPPSLAAITPLSVIGNSATTLDPGGILNNGFATEWISEVLDKAGPYGQGWEAGQVAMGDRTCWENQLLHGQKVNNVAEAYHTPYYDPSMADPLNPTTFVSRIEVPVFLAGAWQDEQTGPYFVTLLDQFTAAPLRRFTVYNGVHEDAFAPQVMAEWHNFLDFFLARKVPATSPKLHQLSPILFMQAFNASLSLPLDRFAGYKSYDQALAAYQAEPSLRAIYDSGAGVAKDPGAPQGDFELRFPAWPPPAQVLRYYLHQGGILSDAPPQETASASSFTLDPDAGQRGSLAPGGDPWAKEPKYDWRPLAAGKAVAFETAALSQDQVMLGTASADLWVRSTADDADLQVSLSEVRQDGQEVYVQAGWLRASQRKLGPGTTDLWPVATHLRQDVAPLVPGQWVLARVAVPGFGHVFHAGSRLRLAVDTPGGTRPEWRFLNKEYANTVTHDIGHEADHPSSVALPLLPADAVGMPAPASPPGCPWLRGQPCRAYQPLTNQPAGAP